MFLSSLEVSGYKLFCSSFTVGFERGLTVLVGENGAGKSAIIDTCGSLTRTPRPIRGTQPVTCTLPCRLWQYTPETITALPSQFAALIANEAELSKRRSCILVRGSSLLAQLHPQRGTPQSPTALFATALAAWHEPQRSTTAIETALQNAGKCLSLLGYAGKGHHQQQYCPDSLKPHEWRQRLAAILNDAQNLYPFEEDLSWSAWATKLKTYLETAWHSLPATSTKWTAASRKIRAPKRKKKGGVAEEMHPTAPTHGLRVTTIHDVKGETFDAVLLISAKNKTSPGGHIDHWLYPDEGKEEYQRIAYVACSRPRHLLVLATPQLPSSQVDELRGLGFEPEELTVGED